MNDNDKFKRFFGFGSNESDQSSESNVSEQDTEKDLKHSLEKAQAALTDWSDKYLTLTADFQNYKKRVSQERLDWGSDAQKMVILDLLEIIDNFERALEQEKKRETTEGSSWLTGFEMIHQSLEKMLAKFGVFAMSDYSAFNPKFHEALMQVESPETQPGDIVQVLQKGYLMHDKVIRPATVSVAK